MSRCDIDDIDYSYGIDSHDDDDDDDTDNDDDDDIVNDDNVTLVTIWVGSLLRLSYFSRVCDSASFR